MVTTTAYEHKVYDYFSWYFTKCLLDEGFLNPEDVAEEIGSDFEDNYLSQIVEGTSSH